MLSFQVKAEYPGSGKDYLLDSQGHKINAVGQARNPQGLPLPLPPLHPAGPSGLLSWAELRSAMDEMREIRAVPQVLLELEPCRLSPGMERAKAEGTLGACPCLLLLLRWLYSSELQPVFPEPPYNI